MPPLHMIIHEVSQYESHSLSIHPYQLPARIGFEDEGDRWRKLYETKTFREDVAQLYETVKPLYQHLHAYVKRRLAKVYEHNQFPTTGHVPAHLFGKFS